MSDIGHILDDLWDNGNCTGLDGWVGPGRGAGEVDDYALAARRRDVQKAHDSILAAGYRKPQQVTTVEELDALPEGSVVMGPWATYQLVFGGWVMLGGPGSVTVELPATVLHVGGAE